ncbi:MAG: hypothetical protein MUO62_05060 [Anaerolineales bacterium]|nr:hypothetical protein [Anaerolineales bacterium]
MNGVTLSAIRHPIDMENKENTAIKAQIADLKRRWPAHSVPPAMLQELDELEEKLEDALKKMESEHNA